MIGAKIRMLRNQRNIKQIQLAKKAGIACTTLCDIEKGRLIPTIKTLQRIANALDVHITTFFADYENTEDNIETPRLRR